MNVRLQSVLAGLLTNPYREVLYKDVIVNGEVVDGGCTAWQAGVGNTAAIKAVTSDLTALSFMTYRARAGYNAVPVNTSCTDPKVAPQVTQKPTHTHTYTPVLLHACLLSPVCVRAQLLTTVLRVLFPPLSRLQILSGYLNRTATNGLYSAVCEGVKWTSRMCPGAKLPSICTNTPFPGYGMGCKDPCAMHTPANPDPLCPNVNVLSPCSATGYACLAKNAPFTAFRVLSADFKIKAPAPTPTFTSVVSRQNAVDIEVSVSNKDGVNAGSAVVCAAFEVGEVPSTTAAVSARGQGEVADKDGSAKFSLDKLEAATAYDVYCTTTSSLGNPMKIADVVKTKYPVKTKCCKMITVNVAVDSLYQGKNALNSIAVVVASQPSTDITITLTTTLAGGSTQALLPASTSIVASGVPVKSFQASISALNTAAPGVVTVVAVVTGTDSADYDVIYPKGNSFEVLSIDVPLPPPIFLGARFGNDGSSLEATFTADTNYGGLTAASWPCRALFDFPGVNATQACKWSSPSTVVMTLGGKASVVPGDALTLLGGKIKSACTLAGGCASWVAAASAAAVIAVPTAPAVPEVKIAAAASISPCDPYKIDFAGSVGNSGRPWKSVAFSMTTTSAAGVAAALAYLNTKYTISPPTIVPAGLFTAGTMNSITVTLCNFLGSCGKASTQLVVKTSAAPVVTITGASLITIGASDELVLTADAFMSVCGDTSGKVSRAGLVYQWTVSSNGVPTKSECRADECKSLASTSKQQYTYLLKPNTLLTGKQYTMKVSVLDQASGASSSSSVDVSVAAGPVVAVTKGGASRSVPAGGSVTIDATASYDADIPVKTGTAAGLSYSWTCAQVAPTISDSCGLTMPAATTASSLTLTAPADGTDAVNVVTMTVFSGARSDTSTVTISTQAAKAPIVTVDAQGGVLNPEKKLVLTASINVAAGTTATASWSVNDSSIALTTAAQTPVTASLSAGVKAMTLVIGAGSLSPGAYLAFTLSCTTADASPLTSVSSVVVAVNAPPTPGTFVVTPASGTELTTEFKMSAVQWVDSDLPLMYTFAFDVNSRVNIVQQLSQNSYATTVLPAGNGNVDGITPAVKCKLTVYDSYMSKSDARAVVAVNVDKSVNTASLASALGSAFSASASPEQSAQMLAVVGAMANVVSCTAAPNCTTLHRLPCQSTPNTCGPCLTSLHLGDAADANTRCILLPSKKAAAATQPLQLRRQVALASAPSAPQWGVAAVGAACDDATNPCAGIFETCVNAKCVLPSKTCTNNCGGASQGVCSYVQVSKGQALADCKQGDALCSAVCACKEGWFGLACDTTSADLVGKQGLRLKLLMGLSNMTANQDATETNIISWAVQVGGLTQNYWELTQYSGMVAASIIKTVIAGAVSKSVAFTDIGLSLQSAVSAVALATDYNNHTNSRTAVGADAVKTMIDGYSQLVLSQLNPLEFDVVYTSDKYRSVAAVKTVASSSVAVSTPLTPLEVQAGVQSSTVTIATTATATNVKVGLSLMRAQTAGDQSGALRSDPIVLTLPDTTVCSAAGCSFTVMLPSIRNVTFVNGLATAKTVVVDCPSVGFKQVTDCGEGRSLTTECTAVGARISTTCPYVVTSPSCSRMLPPSVTGGIVLKNDVCTVTKMTATYTLCACVLPAASFTKIAAQADDGRHLLSTAATSSPAAAVGLVAAVNYAVVTPVPVVTVPTAAPVAGAGATSVTVDVVQKVEGVAADSADFRALFKTAVLSVLPSGSTLDITSVAPAARRQLLASGVNVGYSVTAMGVTAAALTSTLQSPASLLTITTALKATYPTANALAPTVTSRGGSAGSGKATGLGAGEIAAAVIMSLLGGGVLIGGIAYGAIQGERQKKAQRAAAATHQVATQQERLDPAGQPTQPQPQPQPQYQAYQFFEPQTRSDPDNAIASAAAETLPRAPALVDAESSLTNFDRPAFTFTPRPPTSLSFGVDSFDSVDSTYVLDSQAPGDDMGAPPDLISPPTDPPPESLSIAVYTAALRAKRNSLWAPSSPTPPSVTQEAVLRRSGLGGSDEWSSADDQSYVPSQSPTVRLTDVHMGSTRSVGTNSSPLFESNPLVPPEPARHPSMARFVPRVVLRQEGAATPGPSAQHQAASGGVKDVIPSPHVLR